MIKKSKEKNIMTREMVNDDSLEINFFQSTSEVDSDFDKNILRKIHNRNFGMGLSGVLVGPYMEDGGVHMRVYDAQGDQTEETEDNAYVSSRYLNDAGYTETMECKIPFGEEYERISD